MFLFQAKFVSVCYTEIDNTAFAWSLERTSSSIWHPKGPLLPQPGSSSDVNCGLGYMQTQYLNKQCHWAAFINFQDLSIFCSHQDMSMSQSDGTDWRIIFQKQAWVGEILHLILQMLYLI